VALSESARDPSSILTCQSFVDGAGTFTKANQL
jgi:hypothetical protein